MSDKPTSLRVDFDLILHRNYFGELYMDLPYSVELVAALKVVEAEVQKKRDREEAQVKNDFLAKAFNELKANIHCGKTCKVILHGVADYHKKKTASPGLTLEIE